MDWNYVATLLSIIHAASTAGPKFAKIAALATEDLMAHMAEPVAEPDEVEEEA